MRAHSLGSPTTMGLGLVILIFLGGCILFAVLASRMQYFVDRRSGGQVEQDMVGVGDEEKGQNQDSLLG